MKILTDSLRGVLLTAAAGVLVSACGGSQQAHALTPGSTSSQAPAGHAGTVSVPNTPTASNVHISEDILRACNIPDADSYFAFDSSHLTAFDHKALDALATCFEKGPLAGRAMRLIGHADPRGTAEYNITLGQSRADAVEGYLSERGLGRTAMSATSRGAMDATGRNETGWAHDRRVDVLLAD